jgi:dTDP-4-dehydrorhamnose reductase
MGNFRKEYLVIGSKGMLGRHVLNLLKELRVEYAEMDIEDIDIARLYSVMDAVEEIRPRAIINCAAVTDVDGCESAPDHAFSVNARGPENLARACSRFGCLLLHISTDYVFDGLKGSSYREDDPISPLGIYAKSKAEGDACVRQLLPENHCIVRTQWLYGLYGRNFVEAILDQAREKTVLRVVNDQHGSPTYAHDLAIALIRLCNVEARGTVHVTNSGQTTWHGFASAIVKKASLNRVKVLPISPGDLKRPAPRPLYSVLDNSRFMNLTGAPLRMWEEALDEYLSVRPQMS